MKLSRHWKIRWLVLLGCCAGLFTLFGANQLAQTDVHHERKGYVNDFASVIDEASRLQLETILANVKQKTGIDFALVTIPSTGGQDIFGLSRNLARDWNVGTRTTAGKSLLLVLAVNEKETFTQFSRSVQADLPDGVLGEMGQRMKQHVNAGRFAPGLTAGVRYFVSEMAQKLALNVDDFEQAPAVSATQPQATKQTDQPATVVAVESRPVPVKAPVTTVDRPAPAADTPAPNPASIDEDDAEEVELTLTLPLTERIAELKAFLAERPDSKSKARAIELLVSARAALGDERLKKGETVKGVEQFMLAIRDASVDGSDKLFSGVISQIPLNLYVRGERAAAAKAAQQIEAKFGNDAKRLLSIAGFYIGTEQGAEAVRVATAAVNHSPKLAEAHQALALALHISLRLNEAVAEYKRTLQLEPNAKAARRGLADLNRALGKPEEALTLYRQQLNAEPNDKAAQAGLILSLLDLGRTAEANREIETALKNDPRNLPLLAGAAYWFAAHNDPSRAGELGLKAVEIEPRYIWTGVALSRALLAQNKPLEAERAIRFARQYGKFPTLDYELASALAAAGLYEEAAEVLMESFRFKNGEIETSLAGHAVTRSSSFIELLAPERQASIFQFAAADSEGNAKILKDLLAFAVLINADKAGGTMSEERVIAAAREFASGNDAARVHRQLFAASRLLQKGIGFQAAIDLAEAARSSADAGLTVPALTVVVQADELREIRARAISSGGTPSVPDAPRNILSNLLRGRIEDISGWALFHQDKLEQAVEHLQRATAILPLGTPSSRNSLWHLGVALERLGRKQDALAQYIRSYKSGDPDSVRRSVIERLYRTIHGSLAGLEEQLGSALTANQATVSSGTVAQPTPSPESSPTESPAPLTNTPVGSSPAPSPSVPIAEVTPSPAPEATPVETPTATPSPKATPAANPEATSEPVSSPSPAPAPQTPTTTSPSLSASPVEAMHKAKPVVVTIKGRVLDSNGNALANAVVVLISPQGTVITSTTNEQGNFSFTVASSTLSYRLIPSKDGFTFDPVDRLLPGVVEDKEELNFKATANKSP